MVRLLCVGLGGMGHHDWNAALDSGGFVAVAGGDLQEQARQVFAAKTGAPTFADFSEALAAGIPTAELCSLDYGGHACSRTVPDQFNSIISAFLER